MTPTIQIIIAILGSSALFTFIQFLITRHDNKSDKINQLCDKIEQGLKAQAKISEQRYQVLQTEIQTGLDDRETTGKARYLEHREAIQKLNEAIFQLTKNDTEQNQYMKYIGNEIMGLAHDKLVTLTDHYQIRGAITLKEKATLEAIYKPYHEGLGGNGDGEQGYKYAMQLPVITDSQAQEKDKQLKIELLSKGGE